MKIDGTGAKTLIEKWLTASTTVTRSNDLQINWKLAGNKSSHNIAVFHTLLAHNSDFPYVKYNDIWRIVRVYDMCIQTVSNDCKKLSVI